MCEHHNYSKDTELGYVSEDSSLCKDVDSLLKQEPLRSMWTTQACQGTSGKK